jgi:hypothetical protein
MAGVSLFAETHHRLLHSKRVKIAVETFHAGEVDTGLAVDLRINVAYGFLTVGGFLTVFLTTCLFKLSNLYCRFNNQNIKTFNSSMLNQAGGGSDTL